MSGGIAQTMITGVLTKKYQSVYAQTLIYNPLTKTKGGSF